MSDFLQYGVVIHNMQDVMRNAAQYQEYLLKLNARCDGAFSHEELDQACKALMIRQTSPGLITMQRLLRGEKVIVRGFIRELGKVITQE